MIKIPSAAVASFLMLGACAQRPLIYTGSNFGVHVNGLKESIPEKLSVGYERSEYAWLPRGGASSIRGSYDVEYRHPSNIALSELLVTGRAASANPTAKPGAAEADADEKNGKNSQLLVTTNTRMNLGLEGLPSDGAGFSFNFGFKRAVLALFPKQDRDKELDGNGQLASTYVDISVHARDGIGQFSKPKGVGDKRELSSGSGARIVQTIATGTAAQYLAKTESGTLEKRIAGDLGEKVVAPANVPADVPANVADGAAIKELQYDGTGL